MELSIIIISYNSKQFIQRCINSILNSDSHLILEIIVIDNASQDGSPDLVRQNFPKVKLICNTGNLGYAKACNQGIKEAGGIYIFILNPDTELSGGSLGAMTRFMDEYPRCGILGPRLLDEHGKIEFSCRGFFSYSSAFFSRYSLLTKMFPHSKYVEKYLKTGWPHDTVKEVDWVSGAAMMIRKDCLEEIGNFDEGFFMYCEDVDICKRAKDKGWRVVYYPHLELTHIIGGSIRRTSPLAISWHHQSIWHYYKKHVAVNILWDALILAMIFIRAVFLICLGLFKGLSVINGKQPHGHTHGA